MTAREWQMAAYIRDRWMIGQKLTLSLGLRFEYYPLMTRKDSGIERLDLSTYEVLLGGLGNTPEDVGIDLKSFYLAPRIGAMYRLTEDTVLRAGYGQTINPLPWSRPMRGSYPYDIYYNRTADQYRTGLTTGLDSAAVRQEENMYLALGPEVVRSYPEQIQRLLGWSYMPETYMGWVEIDGEMADPIRLLE